MALKILCRAIDVCGAGIVHCAKFAARHDFSDGLTDPHVVAMTAHDKAVHKTTDI